MSYTLTLSPLRVRAGLEPVDSDHLGTLELEPMMPNTRLEKREGEVIRLELWDTHRTDSMGKSVLRYELLEGDTIVFEGEDFRSSPLHSIDSLETFAALLGFLSMRPGDTDAEYFEDYTDEQLEFAERRGEELSTVVYEIENAEELAREEAHELEQEARAEYGRLAREH